MNDIMVSETGSQLSVQTVRDQVNCIQDLMKSVMKDGEHYGVIPGTNGKKSLYKAGAEKLGFTFRLAAGFEITEKAHIDGHVEFIIKCKLTNIESGKYLGEGVGSASTLESKYRYRNAVRVCPDCGKETIIKGKAEYGGGFLCFAKKGGCGAKFTDNDIRITGQTAGKEENPDIADCYNTVLKMAKKRAHVDAIITVTAASDIFTQDIEDDYDIEPKHTAAAPEYIPPTAKPAEQKPAAPAQQAPKQQTQPTGGNQFPYMLNDGDHVPAWFMALPGKERVKWMPQGCSIVGGKICVRKAS